MPKLLPSGDGGQGVAPAGEDALAFGGAWVCSGLSVGMLILLGTSWIGIVVQFGLFSAPVAPLPTAERFLIVTVPKFARFASLQTKRRQDAGASEIHSAVEVSCEL